MLKNIFKPKIKNKYFDQKANCIQMRDKYSGAMYMVDSNFIVVDILWLSRMDRGLPIGYDLNNKTEIDSIYMPIESSCYVERGLMKFKKEIPKCCCRIEGFF